MLLGIGNFLGRGSGRVSGAAQMLAAYSQGLAIDGRDLSMVIKDTGTPANAFSGDPNSKLTYASPSTKWILGSNGLYQSGTTLRTEYSAASAPIGFRIETSRTNLFLNSRAPVTQTITTTAQSYTISGLGAVGATLTLSGTATATLTGTSALDRDRLTFTATGGTLTVTVAGTWDFVQVEAGALASSPIVTSGAAVSRAADKLSLATNLFPQGSAGILAVKFRLASVASGQAYVAQLYETSGGNQMSIGRNTAGGGTGEYDFYAQKSGADQAWLRSSTAAANVDVRLAASYAVNDMAWSVNGAAVPTPDTSGTPPTPGQLCIGGGYFGTNQIDGHLIGLLHLPRNRASNAELQGFLE